MNGRRIRDSVDSFVFFFFGFACSNGGFPLIKCGLSSSRSQLLLIPAMLDPWKKLEEGERSFVFYLPIIRIPLSTSLPTVLTEDFRFCIGDLFTFPTLCRLIFSRDGDSFSTSLVSTERKVNCVVCERVSARNKKRNDEKSSEQKQTWSRGETNFPTLQRPAAGRVFPSFKISLKGFIVRFFLKNEQMCEGKRPTSKKVPQLTGQ